MSPARDDLEKAQGKLCGSHALNVAGRHLRLPIEQSGHKKGLLNNDPNEGVFKSCLLMKSMC